MTDNYSVILCYDVAEAAKKKLDAALELLKNEYSGYSPIVTDTKTHKEVSARITNLRGYWTAVEKRRKELKEESLTYGRKVDAEAQRITDILKEIAAPLTAAKKEYEDQKEAERLEKERIEKERVNVIRQHIDFIRNYPLQLIGKSADAMRGCIRDIIDMEDGNNFDYEEFSAEAVQVKTESLDNMNALLSKQLKCEEDERVRAAAASRAAEKAEAERIEQERRDIIRGHMEYIRNYTLSLIGKTSDEIRALIAELADTEFAPEALTVKTYTMEKMNKILENQCQHEEERRVAVAAEAARQQAEIAERARIAEERRVWEEKRQAEEAALEARRKAEDQERQIAREAEAKALAAQRETQEKELAAKRAKDEAEMMAQYEKTAAETAAKEAKVKRDAEELAKQKAAFDAEKKKEAVIIAEKLAEDDIRKAEFEEFVNHHQSNTKFSADGSEIPPYIDAREVLIEFLQGIEEVVVKYGADSNPNDCFDIGVDWGRYTLAQEILKKLGAI